MSRLHIFHPHNVQQRSGELASLELQSRIRSGTNGKSTGPEPQATVDNCGVMIEGTSALRRLTTSMMNKARQNHLTTLAQ
jgi:hypothetical protein